MINLNILNLNINCFFKIKKGYDYNQDNHLQVKFQIHWVHHSKVLEDENSIILNVTENSTSLSCNHPST